MKTISAFRFVVKAFALITFALVSPHDLPAQITASNLPPVVGILYPSDGAVFTAPADIALKAEAVDRDGSVASVEFFAGTNSLGFGSRQTASNLSSNVFTLVWSNVPLGHFSLTAKATDNLGGSITSAPPVTVSIRPPPLPVVTIRATDPYAAETCGLLTVIDGGRFTIYRSQGTNYDLVVRYSISGTASNGVDYIAISNAVVIPRGAWSANVLIYPFSDGVIEGGETVVLRLTGMACTNDATSAVGCYLIGQPAEATVFIRDCTPSNQPPMVRILDPPSGAAFRANSNIRILADTADLDGYVYQVEFFEGTKKIGQESKEFFVAPPNGTHILYSMMWSNVPPGAYVLTAKANDSMGGTGISAPVRITVVTNVPPPSTNPPPVVTIVATDPVAIEGTNCWPWSSATNRWPLGTTNDVTVRPGCPLPIWWFTNCGPKDAVLTVRRAGDTNADLVVSYAIRGTATNGLDYEALPGFVTVPAGQRKAEIAIVPKDDRRPDPMKTIILKLTPPPPLDSARPPYMVGYPNSAAAILVDSDRPRAVPVASVLSDRCLLIGTDALDGSWYRVECSANLRSWTPICTNQVIEGAIRFVDPEAQDLPARYYRAVPEANPPLD